MKKSLKALAVLSLFGLGLGSVTACGGSSKSITISVNGTAVGAEGVHVDELSTVTFSATIDGGAETDTVVWATNSASAFTFSSTTGNEVTATANTPSTTGYVVSATLEGDASVTTSITVYVDEATRTYELMVDTSNAVTTYDTGDAFSTQGLVVNAAELANGTVVNSYELGADEYTLTNADDGSTIKNGDILTEEGLMTINVTPVDDTYKATSFVISVEFNAVSIVTTTLDSFAKNGSIFMNFVYGQTNKGFDILGYDAQTGIWGDYLVDFVGTNGISQIYHQENGEVRKYFMEKTAENTYNILKYDQPMYYNYEAITDVTEMASLNQIPTYLDIYNDDIEDALTYVEASSDGAYVFTVDPNSSLFNTILNTSGIQYDDAVQSAAASGQKVSAEVQAVADGTSVMFDVYAYPSSNTNNVLAVRSTIYTAMDLSSDSIYGLIDSNISNYQGETTSKARFDDALSKVKGNNFDINYGSNLFGNLFCEMHANDRYVSNEVYITDQTGATMVQVNGIATLPGGTSNVGGEEKTVPAGDYVFMYIDKVTVDQDSDGNITKEFASPMKFITSPTATDKSYFQANDFGAEESNLNLAYVEGFIDYSNLEAANTYWDMEYEVSFTDSSTQMTVEQGSYNFYGSSETDLFNFFVTMLGEDYWNQYVEMSGLPTTLGQCKVNLWYQLVDNSWGNGQMSFIRLTTYLCDGSTDEGALENIGAVDIMTIHNIGNGQSSLLEDFYNSITPTAQN